ASIAGTVRLLDLVPALSGQRLSLERSLIPRLRVRLSEQNGTLIRIHLQPPPVAQYLRAALDGGSGSNLLRPANHVRIQRRVMSLLVNRMCPWPCRHVGN